MKWDSAGDVVTFILILALIMLLLKDSSQFTAFIKWFSGIFNKSIAALGGQNTGTIA